MVYSAEKFDFGGTEDILSCSIMASERLEGQTVQQQAGYCGEENSGHAGDMNSISFDCGLCQDDPYGRHPSPQPPVTKPARNFSFGLWSF